MLTQDAVEQHIEQVEAIVDQLERGEGDGALAFQAHERFEVLRDQYRSAPESLATALDRLAGLRRRFEQQLDARLADVVDRYHALVRVIGQAEAEKAFVREALIRIAETKGEGTLSGAIARVSVERSRSARLPPAGSPERDRLVEIVKGPGHWEQVTQLSSSRLVAAIRRGVFAEHDQRRIEELLPSEPAHRVICRPLGGPMPPSSPADP